MDLTWILPSNQQKPPDFPMFSHVFPCFLAPSPSHEDILFSNSAGGHVRDIGAEAGLGDGQGAALAASDDVLTGRNGIGMG
jgi:hypothetical protein